VATIRQWWYEMGKPLYPDATALGDFLQKGYQLNRADQNIPFGQQWIPF
jgi:hypothetical protein